MSILGVRQVENFQPDLNEYWNKNITLGIDPYIHFLLNSKKQKTGFIQIEYEVELVLMICVQENTTLQEIQSELEIVPIPKDPYLGFWINSEKERTVRSLNPSLHGPVGLCLSNDFLIYGTSPENAWFYWEPVSRATNSICQISQSHLITFFKTSDLVLQPLQSQPTRKYQEVTQSVDATLVFGIVDSKNLSPASDLVARELKLIQSTFKSCEKTISAECITIWSETIKSYLPADADIGYISLLYVLKFSGTLIKNIKLSIIHQGSNFFEIKLSGFAKLNSLPVTIQIYHGPTSVYDKPAAPTYFWDLVLKSLYEADAFFYFGHAGIGQNLKLATIIEHHQKNQNYRKRNSDLFMGIFNCEGFSYFGYDLESLFTSAKKTKKNLYLISSSGVEVRSDAMLGFYEQILEKTFTNPKLLVQHMSDFVSSKDFLTYQHIQF